jgi:hypothetical protein
MEEDKDLSTPAHWLHVLPDSDEVRTLFARLCSLREKGRIDRARLELAYALSEANHEGHRKAIEKCASEKAIQTSITEAIAMVEPHRGLRGTLTAWLDALAYGTGKEEAERTARVMLDYAGRFAWLAEIKDAAAALRFTWDECTREQTAHYSLHLDEEENEIADDVLHGVEASQMQLAFDQLADMGCTSVFLNLPDDAQAWEVSVMTHCGCNLTERAAVEDGGLPTALRVAAETVGKHLQGQRKAHLDS